MQSTARYLVACRYRTDTILLTRPGLQVVQGGNLLAVTNYSVVDAMNRIAETAALTTQIKNIKRSSWRLIRRYVLCTQESLQCFRYQAKILACAIVCVYVVLSKYRNRTEIHPEIRLLRQKTPDPLPYSYVSKNHEYSAPSSRLSGPTAAQPRTRLASPSDKKRRFLCCKMINLRTIVRSSVCLAQIARLIVDVVSCNEPSTESE